LRKLDETSARFGEWVDVPRLKHGGLMLSIHLEERLSGKLMTLLYKQSSLLLELKFANGAAVTSRILRNLVSDGFLVLSPDIDSAGLLLQAERNFDIAGENPLISIRVSPVDLANVAFSPTYVLSTMSVSVIGAPEQPRSARPPSADDAMRRLRTGQIIASSGLRMIDGRLLAHAPSKISARFPGDRELSGEIGFFDGAWKTGKPQPVTFVISALTSMGAKPLLERTLDPLNRTEDRGPQFFSIALPAAFPPGTTVELLFETRPETPWGWTYWSNLQMTPPVEGR
jgi:hypothetical protein